MQKTVIQKGEQTASFITVTATATTHQQRFNNNCILKKFIQETVKKINAAASTANTHQQLFYNLHFDKIIQKTVIEKDGQHSVTTSATHRN